MKVKSNSKSWEHINIFIIGTIGYIFITLLKISLLKSESNDITYLLLDIFGNLNILSNNFMTNYSMYIYNFIIIMYITSSYIYDDFGSNAIYIFTRTNNRTKWTRNKVIELIKIIIEYFLIQYMVVIIMGMFSGYQIYDLGKFFILAISTFIFINLNILIISMLTNIIAFKIGKQISYAIGATIMSISILFVYIGVLFDISNKSYRLIPFTNAITSWYSEFNNIINREIYLFNFFIEGNFLIINVIISFIVIFILYKVLKKVVCGIEII